MYIVQNIPHLTMKKRPVISASVALMSMMFGAVAGAFYDEMIALKRELQLYETAHASDFSDVLAQLDGITGSVFTDVNDRDWFQPYVTSLAEWNIVSGYKDAAGKSTGLFKPAASVTIAEALKMAMKAAKVDETTCTATPAHKTAVGHWAQMYVACGEKMGLRILKTETIDLNRLASRAEVVGIVFDTFGDKAPAMFSEFTDTAKSPYESDIAYANLLGIVSGDRKADGTARGTFRPGAAINRAEVTKVVYERLKIEARKELASQGTTPSL